MSALEETIKNKLNAPHQMVLLMKKNRINEVKKGIKQNPSQQGPRLRPDHRKTSKTFPNRSQSDTTYITPYYESNTFPVNGI